MKNLLKNLPFIFLFIAPFIASAQSDTGDMHKIVFQFVSADTLSQQSLVNNLKNLREGWSKAEVEVVFHGNGIYMVVEGRTKYAEELKDLAQQQKIKMVVCNNTMKQKKISRGQLLPFVEIVPMGIGEIVLKQEHGWSYIKAGL